MNELALLLSTYKFDEPEAQEEKPVVKSDKMQFVADWLEECCEAGKSHQASNKIIWESWKAYAEERGVLHAAPTMAHLSVKLTELGFERYVRGRDRGFDGFRVRITRSIYSMTAKEMIEYLIGCGVSRKQIAVRIKVTYGYVLKLKTGESKSPGAEVINALRRYCAEINDLAGGNDAR